jgi:hypothetical protein
MYQVGPQKFSCIARFMHYEYMHCKIVYCIRKQGKNLLEKSFWPYNSFLLITVLTCLIRLKFHLAGKLQGPHKGGKDEKQL